ncbi:hypothetical protein [Microcoleus sp. M2_C4]|uniref:hypothetical protein n=1 Tax=Microcoleus sp. M2_C4 TaxID=3055370 RepID=UPI002FCFCC86
MVADRQQQPKSPNFTVANPQFTLRPDTKTATIILAVGCVATLKLSKKSTISQRRTGAYYCKILENWYYPAPRQQNRHRHFRGEFDTNSRGYTRVKTRFLNQHLYGSIRDV